jgi:tetratricopeptide (TPR) repeat protein
MAEAYFSQARAYEKSSRLDEAIQAYQQALRHKRDFPYALLNLGVLYYHRKEWRHARDAFDEALLFDKNYAKAYFNLSLVNKLETRYRHNHFDRRRLFILPQ